MNSAQNETLVRSTTKSCTPTQPVQRWGIDDWKEHFWERYKNTNRPITIRHEQKSVTSTLSKQTWRWEKTYKIEGNGHEQEIDYGPFSDNELSILDELNTDPYLNGVQRLVELKKSYASTSVIRQGTPITVKSIQSKDAGPSLNQWQWMVMRSGNFKQNDQTNFLFSHPARILQFAKSALSILNKIHERDIIHCDLHEGNFTLRPSNGAEKIPKFYDTPELGRAFESSINFNANLTIIDFDVAINRKKPIACRPFLASHHNQGGIIERYSCRLHLRLLYLQAYVECYILPGSNENDFWTNGIHTTVAKASLQSLDWREDLYQLGCLLDRLRNLDYPFFNETHHEWRIIEGNGIAPITELAVFNWHLNILIDSLKSYDKVQGLTGGHKEIDKIHNSSWANVDKLRWAENIIKLDAQNVPCPEQRPHEALIRAIEAVLNANHAPPDGQTWIFCERAQPGYLPPPPSFLNRMGAGVAARRALWFARAKQMAPNVLGILAAGVCAQLVLFPPPWFQKIETQSWQTWLTVQEWISTHKIHTADSVMIRATEGTPLSSPMAGNVESTIEIRRAYARLTKTVSESNWYRQGGKDSPDAEQTQWLILTQELAKNDDIPQAQFGLALLHCSVMAPNLVKPNTALCGEWLVKAARNMNAQNTSADALKDYQDSVAALFDHLVWAGRPPGTQPDAAFALAVSPALQLWATQRPGMANRLAVYQACYANPTNKTAAHATLDRTISSFPKHTETADSQRLKKLDNWCV